MSASVNNYSDVPPVLRDFLIYISTIKNLSAKTVDAYYVDLRGFFRYIKKTKFSLSDDIPFEDIAINDVDIEVIRTVTLADIYEYLFYVSRERANNSNTRARKVSSLRSYFKYLSTKAKLIDNDPAKDLEIPSIKRALPKYLSREQSLELLHCVGGEYAERDYCIIVLLLNCGMRLSELVGINLKDIREDSVRIVGKGNKERIVYLNDACLYAIEQYKNVRGKLNCEIKDKDALFLSRRGTRLTNRRVEQIVEQWLGAAGLSGQGYSPHKLRHTAATMMYRYGNVDMLALKEILGHAHVSTTEIYTHISDDQLRRAADASPFSDIKLNVHKNKN